MTVAAGPGPVPVVAISPGPVDTPAPADPRAEAILAYWGAMHDDPQQIMAGMTAYGVDAAELASVTGVNIVDYLRTNGAADGFAGVHVWSTAETTQFQDWQYAQPTFWGGHIRSSAHDAWTVMDIAYNREQLYIDAGLIGRDFSPWNDVL